VSSVLISGAISDFLWSAFIRVNSAVSLCFFPTPRPWLLSVSPPLDGRCRLWFADHRMPRSPDHPIFTPTRLFRVLLLQTKALTQILPCATLGWPLRGPWVAQGWPKRHPNPIPGRQRVASRFRFWPVANCSIFKELSLPHPGALSYYSYFIRPYQ
jgi:hypothetical protein